MRKVFSGNSLKRGMRLSVMSCVALTIMLCGCGEREPDTPVMIVEESNDTITYNYSTVEKGDVILTRKVRCTYRQQKDQEIIFSISGRLVDKVYVEEGDTVKKGDLLVELSAGNLENQIEDLEYRITRNEMLMENAKTNEELEISQAWVNYLYNHYYSREGLDKAIESIKESYRYQREDSGDALNLDRMELEQLKKELACCRIYAGMDGMVYKLQKNLEDSTSTEGKIVMYIVDNSECLFETEIPEYASCFHEGETVDMTVISGSASGDYKLVPYNIENWGEVQQFSVYSGPVTTGIEVGTGGTIQFVVERREQVLCVPLSAVNQADDKYYVYVTDADNMRQIRWVETGLHGDDSVEIISGLEEGERVIRK